MVGEVGRNSGMREVRNKIEKEGADGREETLLRIPLLEFPDPRPGEGAKSLGPFPDPPPEPLYPSLEFL